jgi:flagellar hook-length control protein FliK
VRNTDFIIQLAERIRAEAGGGEGIRIQLKPANLGRVEINAESGAAGLVARIVTESGAVRLFLEGNLQVLEQALQDQGLRVERIDIVTQEGLDLRPSTGNQQGGPGAGHASGSSDPQSSRGGVIREQDAIELDPATLVALGPNSTFHTVA